MKDKIENKDTILFVVNPKSGGVSQKIIDRISSLNYDTYVIRDHNSFQISFAEQIAPYRLIVVVGGDGTISTVASFLINTDKILAVFPAGSGNGFARSVGFRKDLPWLLAQIESCTYMNMDTFTVNNNLTINVAGIGFDSLVAKEFSHSRRRGFISYSWIVARLILRYQGVKLRILGEGFDKTGEFFLLSIANNCEFGNGAVISPTSNPFDGKIEVVFIRKFKFYEVPSLLYLLFKGKIDQSKVFEQLTLGAGLVIQSEGIDCYHVDGEVKHLSEQIRIKPNPASLKVLAVDTTMGR